MIYFTIPSEVVLTAEDITVYIDREPTAESNLSLHTFSTAVLSQTAPNGINIRDEVISFYIKNIPIATTASYISLYLQYLKNNNLELVYPEETKNYHVLNWNIIIKNQVYADFMITAELMYL